MEEYAIEYQVSTGEPVEESWTTIANNGTITGVNHNDTIYARLTDETNYGEYASTTITDTTEATVEIEVGEITYNIIAVTVNATDGESGLAEADTYKYYLNDAEENTSTNSTYTFTGLTEQRSYSIKVEVTDKAGNVGSQTISISTIARPGMSSSQISQGATTYYGAEVTNYTYDSEGVDT